MASSAHLLHLKRPGALGLGFTLASPTQCASRARVRVGPIAAGRSGVGARLRHGLTGGGRVRRGAGLGLGLGGVAVAAAGRGDGEAGEVEVVAEEVDPNENSSFPAEFRELLVDRGDPPNLFLYAAGFCVVVLMRDVILQEIASWGLNFARIALYIGEYITIGLGQLTNVAATPVALLMNVVSWAIMAADDIYTLIVDGAPVRSLLSSLFLSLAVLSIGDAATSKVKGSRSRLVGIATAIGLAGVLEFIPPEAVIPSLVVLTAFAKFIQKADLVTVLMPATVSLVTISEPIIQAAALGIFLAVSIYASWRSAQQPEGQQSEQTPSQMREIKASSGMRPSFVFLAITASICISLGARFLYLRSVKWLLLRGV
ncbi:hypothetical protein KC19_9G133300 [Ceratodon purpureus]|uniref:Uncharacterized protein n=1 Tax=Ceratodon purpureus TaxID=3225 RepID=A0A8T0GVA7_CERPU|nr:hypothetical protein KC19_9G133300 [Ceratodon purpureus]